MDTDSEEEWNQSFSEDENNVIENQDNVPWQCGLPNLNEKVLALYRNGNFTDITLTFPETDITYDAHRLILAISSPVFESILYGPMRIEGRNVLLHGDDPLIMEYVIAHCYGEDLEPPDLDTALEVYKLADKYILDSLKNDCYKHIVSNMNLENNKDIIEFAEGYNFTDIISKCLPLIIELFKEALASYEEDECYIDDPNNTNAFHMLMSLNDTWIEGLLSEVNLKVLEFNESWKYPVRQLEDNRLRTIISSSGSYLDKFYGCVNSECIQQFPLKHISENRLELNLSVTDLHHAKRVIDAINQQNRFESDLIALHIRCEEVWPINWSPIQPERTHRPSLLLISDADDDKTSWVVEAAKAFLPQCEGSYSKVFIGNCHTNELEIANMLFLPRSQFTPNGFINLLQELSISGVKCKRIFFESPHINYTHHMTIVRSIQVFEQSGFNPVLFRNDGQLNIFRDIFDWIPEHYGD